ncbi:class D beta-lactamase [Fundidesulfovibrio terrae]|uniref:class D beta-lactamase n=1 Tax=Fundidesulfovibrio terrae TaxID=2922866 RepID=UPI001FAEE86E|nr:class D beta-lactamase [Fundidesulfovibrio terrae]
MRMRLILFAVLLLQACAATANRQPSTTERADWGRHFQAAGVEGTMVLMKEGSGRMQVYNPARARTQYLPASTFKVLNSLIALETGVSAGPDTIFPWDGKEHPLPAWNRDLTMREAFAVSSVPVYQGIARAIGQERMARYVDAVKYGNADIGGGLDTFWLEGNLRISAVEQIDFLRRLYEEHLPFFKRSMDTVKDIMAQDRGAGWVIRSKTGWAGFYPKHTSGGPDIGWWVGWLERKGEVWFFALNIDLKGAEQAKARKDVVLAVLGAEGLLP